MTQFSEFKGLLRALCSHEALGLCGTEGDPEKVRWRVGSPLREEETTGVLPGM
jgi:hypothetical protein